MYQKISASKTCCQEKHVDLLLIRKEKKRKYVFIKYFNISCMIILYIVEKTFLWLLLTSIWYRNKNYKVILKTTLKLMTNKEL